MAKDLKTEIRFDAEVVKVQTMESGQIRLTLDLAEQCVPQMAQLALVRQAGAIVHVVMVPEVMT